MSSIDVMLFINQMIVNHGFSKQKYFLSEFEHYIVVFFFYSQRHKLYLNNYGYNE